MSKVLKNVKKGLRKGFAAAKKYKLVSKLSDQLEEGDLKNIAKNVAEFSGTGVLKDVKKIGKKTLNVSRKYKLLSKLGDALPEGDIKNIVKNVGKISGTGVLKDVKKGLKKVNRFAKKTGIISKALLLADQPELAGPAALLGYGGGLGYPSSTNSFEGGSKKRGRPRKVKLSGGLDVESSEPSFQQGGLDVESSLPNFQEGGKRKRKQKGMGYQLTEPKIDMNSYDRNVISTQSNISGQVGMQIPYIHAITLSRNNADDIYGTQSVRMPKKITGNGLNSDILNYTMPTVSEINKPKRQLIKN